MHLFHISLIFTFAGDKIRNIFSSPHSLVYDFNERSVYIEKAVKKQR